MGKHRNAWGKFGGNWRSIAETKLDATRAWALYSGDAASTIR